MLHIGLLYCLKKRQCFPSRWALRPHNCVFTRHLFSFCFFRFFFGNDFFTSFNHRYNFKLSRPPQSFAEICPSLFLLCFSSTIVYLQETHSTSHAEFDRWIKIKNNNDNNKPKYKVLSSHGTTRSRGVAVIYHPYLTVTQSASDSQGRLQLIHFSYLSLPFRLVNIYGPKQKEACLDFFQTILPLVNLSLSTIVCGDFNAVVDPNINHTGCNPNSPWAYNWPHTLATLTSDMDLVNIWRLRHPN